MKKIIITSTLIFNVFLSGIAQERVWTLNECMEYAVENSPVVKQRVYETDNAAADRLAALGAFLPSVNAGVGVEYSFGRSIDQNTNNYIDANSFSNSYSLGANLPLFRGGQLINQWKQSKANLLLGKSAEAALKDEQAMNTMQAFMDVIFYEGMIQFAAEKLDESTRTYQQTKRMEELGLKSKADVAQIEAQMAGDDYSLVRYENLYKTSLSTLKEYMNYPYDEELIVASPIGYTTFLSERDNISDIYEYAKDHNPIAKQADYRVESNKYNYRISKGSFFPAISFSAGINTYYFNALGDRYREVTDEETGEKWTEVVPKTPFGDQLKLYRTDYVGFTMNIPIFNNLNKITNLRKAKNNLRIAIEKQNETLRQLQNAIQQNVQDKEGYLKEIIQMDKQVDANDIAYRLTLRKYEEGLSSSLDLQTSSNNLIESRANLLQRQLMYIMKEKIVDYYKGVPLIQE